VNTWC